MKKIFIIFVILVVLVILTQITLFAHHRTYAPENFLNLYKNEGIWSAGLKQQISDGIYGTANIQYLDTKGDLEFQAGAVYLIPRKILFFRLYGGTGFQFSRNEGYQYPYVVLGTDFLIFFSEVIHPMVSRMEPKYRAGFSFHF